MAALNGSRKYLCCSRYYSLNSSEVAPIECSRCSDQPTARQRRSLADTQLDQHSLLFYGYRGLITRGGGGNVAMS